MSTIEKRIRQTYENQGVGFQRLGEAGFIARYLDLKFKEFVEVTCFTASTKPTMLVIDQNNHHNQEHVQPDESGYDRRIKRLVELAIDASDEGPEYQLGNDLKLLLDGSGQLVITNMGVLAAAHGILESFPDVEQRIRQEADSRAQQATAMADLALTHS